MPVEFTLDLTEFTADSLFEDVMTLESVKQELEYQLYKRQEQLNHANEEVRRLREMLDASSGPKFCRECGKFADTICCEYGHTLSL